MNFNAGRILLGTFKQHITRLNSTTKKYNVTGSRDANSICITPVDNQEYEVKISIYGHVDTGVMFLRLGFIRTPKIACADTFSFKTDFKQDELAELLDTVDRIFAGELTGTNSLDKLLNECYSKNITVA
jgi:hypothetical protein